MLKLHELKPYNRATKRRKVVGRGVGSGHGTFSTRGAKGQKARSGSSIPVGFKGGDTVNPKVLFNLGLINSAQEEVKILSSGTLLKALTFEKIKFSAAALEKVQKAG